MSENRPRYFNMPFSRFLTQNPELRDPAGGGLFSFFTPSEDTLCFHPVYLGIASRDIIIEFHELQFEKEKGRRGLVYILIHYPTQPISPIPLTTEA